MCTRRRVRSEPRIGCVDYRILLLQYYYHMYPHVYTQGVSAGLTNKSLVSGRYLIRFLFKQFTTRLRYNYTFLSLKINVVDLFEKKKI